MDASQLYPLRLNTIREIIDDPSKLKGKRSEVRIVSMIFNAFTKSKSLAYSSSVSYSFIDAL